MKKVDAILADLEKIHLQGTLNEAQVKKLIDSLTYTPFKQYLLCLQVGVKAEDATSILLRRLAEDLFEKIPFAEMRLKSGISETALQETVNQPVLLIAKSLFKTSKNDKGEITALKIETLSIENYENSIIAYLADNEFVVLTNFKEVFVFDRDAKIEFKPQFQTTFGDLVLKSKEKNSLSEILTELEIRLCEVFSPAKLKLYDNQEVLLKNLSKTLEKLAKGKEIYPLIFIKNLESYGLLPYRFLENLYQSNQQLWESKKEEFVFQQFSHILKNWLPTFYFFDNLTIELNYQDFEKLIFAKNEKIKALSDYNYRKINEYILGKAFENLHEVNNEFPEQIYDVFCEDLIKQLFENQVNKIIENISKNNLKKAKQQFEEIQKIPIANPFFESGILLAKLLKLIFLQYQRIINQIDNILDEKQSLLDKDENWKKLSNLKEELGLNDSRKFIANIIHNQLFISLRSEQQASIKTEQSYLLKIAKLNLYLAAIKLAPSAFHFRKHIPEEEKKAFAKFEYSHELPAAFSSIFFVLSLEKWKNREYKTLIIKYFKLITENGFLSIVIPSPLLFNESDTEIRKLLFVENTLIEAKLFEQGKTEWCLLRVQKKKPTKNQAFKIHYLSLTTSSEDEQAFEYKNSLIAGFSPEQFNITKFDQAIDYQICSKIRGTYSTLAEQGFYFKNEFKITNDSNFFLRSQEENTLPLYEAKNIEHYTFHKEVKYFIPKEKAHTQLLTKEINQVKKAFELSQKNYELIGIFNEKNFLLNYQTYRLVVSQSPKLSVQTQTTAEVAAVHLQAALLPPHTFVENSLLYLENFSYEITSKDLIQNLLPIEGALLLLALLNSFTVSFYAKMIGLKDIHALPLPKISQDLKQQISEKTFTILYNQHDFQVFNELRKQLHLTNVPSIPQPLFSEVRLDLERLIAQEVFGLTEEEFGYVS